MVPTGNKDNVFRRSSIPQKQFIIIIIIIIIIIAILEILGIAETLENYLKCTENTLKIAKKELIFLNM